MCTNLRASVFVCLGILGGCRFALSIGTHTPDGAMDARNDAEVAVDVALDAPPEASPDVRVDAVDARDDGIAVDAADVMDVPVSLREPITLTALGSGLSCGRAESGSVWCWGTNTSGAFGNGTTIDSLRPTPGFSGVARVRTIAIGASHACVVGEDAQIRCAGANADGQLGDGTRVDRVDATRIVTLPGVQQIAAGEAHTCAIVTPGAVHCWGRNDRGQLGDGTASTRVVPTSAGIMDAVQLATASSRTCAVHADGRVSCWGDGFGNSPTLVAGITDAAQVAVGRCHACIVSTAGRLRCWGCNSDGQLGDETTIDRAVPVDVSGLGTVLQVAARERHTCARAMDSVSCWGDGAMGQLGAGDRMSRTRATGVLSITRVGTSHLASGSGHSCAVLTDRNLWCWGANGTGALGDGTTTDRLSPILVAP